MTYILKIARSSTMPATTLKVASLEAASKAYAELRDESMEGASTFPFGKLKTPEGEMLQVSYNGKIWRLKKSADKPWQDDNELLFNPYA